MTSRSDESDRALERSGSFHRTRRGPAGGELDLGAGVVQLPKESRTYVPEMPSLRIISHIVRYGTPARRAAS
jgi:hypothetical protein